MMRIARPRSARKGESTIALINVVFLMLIFFLIAGTLAPAPDREVDYITLSETQPAAPPDMVFIRADGTVTWRGDALPLKAQVGMWLGLQGDAEEPRPLRIAADRALPAALLLDTLERLRAAGIPRIVLLAEKEAP